MMHAITLETMQAVIRENRDTIDDQKRLRAIGKCHIGDNPDEQKTLSYFFRVVMDYLGICLTNPGEFIESWGEATPLPGGKAYIQKLCIDYQPEILVSCLKYGHALCLNEPYRRVLQKEFEKYPDVQVCILTNGLEYEIYTDSASENEIDEKPLYTFNILDLSAADLQVLNSVRSRRSIEVLRSIKRLQ